jgi:hypothetical protein
MKENANMPMSTRRALCGLLTVTALSTVSLGALAAPPKPAPANDERPKAVTELFKDGERRYDAGDYADALSDFEAVDGREASAETARFIGLCQDKLGHFHPAVRAYERFLAEPPAKLAGEVGAIVRRVDEIKAMPAKLRIETVPAGSTVTIDGAVQMQPSPLDVTLAPGKHLIHVAAPDYDALERDVDASFASTQNVSMALTAKLAPPAPPPPTIVIAPPAPTEPLRAPPPPPPPAVTRRTVALAAAGVAVVGAGVATVFGVLALHNKSEYQSGPTYLNSDKGNNDAAYADGGIALAVAAGVTSLVLFLTSDPKDCGVECVSSVKKPTTAFSASPFVTPHGAGAGAVLRF